MQDIEKKIIFLLQQISQYIPDSDVIEMFNLVEEHGEYGLAMEALCSVLEEKKIPISNKILDEIIELFREMDFGSDVLSYYKDHLTTL